ncbi:putative transcriptional regulator [Coniochaeta ligniaria NRRL 30616]|uniref:Putative transcriptional regulator n=1 Tax=Coniochaeta ligniaria NRRL 30616 TaxID=1408157 RepID=A0A1J7I4I8_9PEZI|nr:putative transcriptional regulator [Coniochaeta ligniaria NRRL 30616]
MYLRAVHAETHIPTLRQLIRDFPLGILTTAFSSTAGPSIQSSHIPFLLDVQDESSETELGRLRGHLARANPQSKALIEAVSKNQGNGTTPSNILTEEVLVLFTSPVQHYVTPKFYTETKPATGKVVPTWNYAAVQAYGRARIYFDARSEETSAFLSRQISDLSEHAETSIMGYTGPEDSRPAPWSVKDSPERYVELLRKAIIGVEIEITRLEGKFKMSQELGAGDREGVVAGFQGLGTEVAQEVAKLVEQRAELKGKTS